MNKKRLELIINTYLRGTSLLHSEEGLYVKCVLIPTDLYQRKKDR